MYTASFAFFEALWELGITHCFVNLGSDHPSIMEAMVKCEKEKKGQSPRIITCPNEMVAMSMADGYARLSGQLQCVLVHVDVGTQGLGAAVHNASTGRAPVLIFAGLSPATLDGEMRGSRTEFIHWLQDVPDQKLIVSQYMRYAQDIKTGKNIKQMVARALQFAMSGPQGPSYLCGAREVMEEEITPYSLRRDEWAPVQLGGLPEDAVRRVGIALLEAKEPLVVTGYVGRRHEAPDELVRLANTIKGLRVLDTGGSDMCFPSDHPGWLGLKFGFDKSIETADVILILDCDVPWIPTRCRPLSDARIFHIDVDPLKQMMPLFYVAAHERFRADSLAALRQLNHLLRSDDETQKLLTSKAAEFNSRWESLVESHRSRLADIAARATPLPALSTEEGSRVPFGTGYLCRRLRELCPEDTIWVIEAVTNTVFVHDNLAPTLPGSWINCGGGGLGWSGGAALGIKLASDTIAGGFGEQGWNKGKFVVAIVGDGSFLFSVPGSVFWIAKRYRIPVLTIVLNNNGWNAPRQSMMLVHPNGLGSQATNADLNISFEPSPDYSGLAKAAAAGDLFAGRVDDAAKLDDMLKEAIESVKSGMGAVLDCKVENGC